MTYATRIALNRVIVSILMLAVFALGIWSVGVVFETVVMSARNDLMPSAIRPVVTGVRVVAFICMLTGSVVTSFFKTNKDTLLMGMGPYELRREIDLLSAALEQLESSQKAESKLIRVEKTAKQNG